MQTVTIMETPGYRLNSHGNGWAYTLFRKVAVIQPAPTSPDDPAETWQSCWFQDDDATRFREELDDMEEAAPERLSDEILGELWGQYACN